MSEKEPILILAGPTAVGKTDTSIGLADRIGGEIVNADSMQVYRGMDIGTAKIKKEEMAGIPHHLFDICEPEDLFDVVRYKTKAQRVIKDIHERGHVPILVGGTGFYIQAVLYDIDFGAEEPDLAYRRMLSEEANTCGDEALHEKLRQIDPEAADQIHANNRKRVIRALEFFHTTGKKISVHNREQRQKESPYSFLYAVLTLPREVLYERIEKRVDHMLLAGLADEVQALLDKGVPRNTTSMQGLGYKEIASYLTGEVTKEDAVYTLKKNTRHFAKRQLTWFKRERSVTWFEKNAYGQNHSSLIDAIVDEYKKKDV